MSQSIDAAVTQYFEMQKKSKGGGYPTTHDKVEEVMPIIRQTDEEAFSDYGQ